MYNFFLIITLGFMLINSGFSQAAEEKRNLLLMIPPILTASSAQNTHPNPIPPPPEVTSTPLVVKIYVAGESVEKQNNFDFPPFNSDGTLNNRGAENNTTGEFGWMVPFSEKLKLRDPALSITWVGSDCWNDHNYECSNGIYTNENIGQTSAISGSTVEAWVSSNGDELTTREFCYDIAFASRGGNDLNSDIPAATYKSQLRQLIISLDQGSNCRTHPLIYVTAHIMDNAGWNWGYQQADVDKWMDNQKHYYVTQAQELVDELNSTNGMEIRFLDMWTPFLEDKETTAFPSETWWARPEGSDVSMPDMNKIHYDGEQHPRRLASIFAGENAANQINITELRQLAGDGK